MGVSQNTTPMCSGLATVARQPGPAWKRFGWKLLLCIFLAAVPVGILVAHSIAEHNFHIVSAGLVYRSGQLDPPDLTRVVSERGIKSILNLRGNNGYTPWYKAETNTSRILGLKHIDFELAADHELSNAEMEKLLAVIKQAPKPILIHCKSGSDRTGLVGALYLYGMEGKSADVADRELTMMFGHIPAIFWNTKAMDRSFWRYVGNHSPREAQNDVEHAQPVTTREKPVANAALRFQ